MRILSIETSCDETGVAIVEGTKTDNGFTFAVLGNALHSQASMHAEFGGVFPSLAKREHEKNLPIILEQALRQAEQKLSEKIAPDGTTMGRLSEDFFSGSFGAAIKNALQIDAIAVTYGPGLEPALWTGITFAKQLANEWGVPLLPTNHMEGHLLSSLAQPLATNSSYANVLQKTAIENVQLPVLALLISGGHTEFVLMRNWFEYEIIGKTLDDAVGEAFDKVARMLALPYPGGPEISKLAELARNVKQHLVEENGLVEPGEATRGPFLRQDVAQRQNQNGVVLPRPMLNTKNNDVSFSGLKTAVLYALRDRGGIQKLSADDIMDFAREFEDAATEVLVHKTKRALDETGAQTFVIGGGVAANTHIRKNLVAMVAESYPEVEVRLPEIGITGDNAIMIAEAALARALTGIHDSATDEVKAKGNLSIQNK